MFSVPESNKICLQEVRPNFFDWEAARRPPIEEVGPMIVFNATFGGEQRVGPTLNQRHFALFNTRKMGCLLVKARC